MRNLVCIFSFVLVTSGQALAQEKQKHISLTGYLSALQSVMFDTLSGPVLNDNILHNRLNIKGYAGSYLTYAVELRNRFFTGDMVSANGSYSKITGSDQGLFDLSWNLLDEPSFFLNTTIDRLWFDVNVGKLQARIGRQRINWGQTLVWNPNDIFNAYSFFDFDYIERPGSDAVRIQYYPESSSAIEIAVKADYENDITAAVLYRLNSFGYDIQFLAGYANSEDFVAGTGWSGALGSASFRGEASWFLPIKKLTDSLGTALITLGFDRVFGNNSMAQFQIMYCNNPITPGSFTSLYSGKMSTKDLAFSKFSAFGQYSYPVTPLVNISVSGMWFPDLKGYFAGPAFDYSMAENVDLSVIWQHFNSVMAGTKTRINLAFLRFRYSF